MADVVRYQQCVFSSSTKRSYRTHQSTYNRFCSIMHISPAPASTDHLCMYAAYLARFLLPQSIFCYLNYIGLLHKSLGLPNPLSDNWTLTSVLKGIRRVYGVPPRPRLPITLTILAQLHSRLNLNCSLHASFWATCLVSFYGLFRKSHLLPDSGNSFDSVKQFTRNDFCRTSYGFLLTVRWSKTIQLGQRVVYIPLVALTSNPLCPVSAILNAFFLTPAALPTSQAFCTQSRSSHVSTFTYKSFMSLLKLFLSQVGLNTSDYGTHSFRRGGASFALEAGIPLDTIALLGDWKSDSLFLYLYMPLSQRLSAQRTMASCILQSTPTFNT